MVTIKQTGLCRPLAAWKQIWIDQTERSNYLDVMTRSMLHKLLKDNWFFLVHVSPFQRELGDSLLTMCGHTEDV